MLSLWLVLIILALAVMLCAASFEEPHGSEPHETIHAIGTEARQKTQELSEQFLYRAFELLTQKKR